MTWTTVVGLVFAGLYAAVLVALAVAIAKTPPLYQAPERAAADEELIADLTASMRAYGETVADYYDTEGTQ